MGYTALPPWRDGLLRGDWLLLKAEAVAIVLGLSEGSYDGKADPDTHLDGGRGFLTQDEVSACARVQADAQVDRKFMELQARMAAENTAWLAAQAPKKRKGWF